jgi:hypothetical protein
MSCALSAAVAACCGRIKVIGTSLSFWTIHMLGQQQHPSGSKAFYVTTGYSPLSPSEGRPVRCFGLSIMVYLLPAGHVHTPVTASDSDRVLCQSHVCQHTLWQVAPGVSSSILSLTLAGCGTALLSVGPLCVVRVSPPCSFPLCPVCLYVAAAGSCTYVRGRRRGLLYVSAPIPTSQRLRHSPSHTATAFVCRCYVTGAHIQRGIQHQCHLLLLPVGCVYTAPVSVDVAVPRPALHANTEQICCCCWRVPASMCCWMHPCCGRCDGWFDVLWLGAWRFTALYTASFWLSAASHTRVTYSPRLLLLSDRRPLSRLPLL